MADIAFNSVGKVVQIALKIKEAVETVKHNEECRDIQRCVARVSALLKRLEETTGTMKDEAVRGPLEDLAVSLEHALVLVTECQQKHFFGRFLGSGDMAKKLDRVQNDIVRKLQLGNFATIVQATIVVTNIQSSGAPPLPPPPPPPEERVLVIDGFIQFSFSELKAATEDFLDKNIIAKGVFGTVYKGVLSDGGQVVAIKKLHVVSSVNDKNKLYDEINIGLELKHKNIVRPLGYCHEIKMILVKHEGKYSQARCVQFCFVEEYMPNGSMNDIINGYRLIDWSIRSKMIQGIAQGLHYLHGQCVVHLDMKPANILLDFDMNPWINDFGVAKKLEHGDVEITLDNNSLVGTLGYMAPEYIFHGIVSTKCDVYAFGITLHRTISTMCISTNPDVGDLSGWAREVVRMEELLDFSLCHKSQLMQIKRFMEVGLLCVEFDREDRPTMEDVLAMLNGEKELPAVKQPWV